MNDYQLSRRKVLQGSASAALSLAGVGKLDLLAAVADTEFPPTRVITRGPRFHWFGYYDKLQFDPTGRFVLGMEVTFQHRSPRGYDRINVGMVDLEDGDRWIELGQTSAWCWQQACMLQWLPGSKSKVLWNDRVDDRFICRMLDVETNEAVEIPHALYSVSPNGKSAVTLDFRRIQDVRPGYGYSGLTDPHADDLAPRESGVFHIDLSTGEAELVISLADIARLGPIPDAQLGIKHYFNHEGEWRVDTHPRFSPDGGFVCIDSPDGEAGRQLHLIDIRGIVS